ncbi:zinc finger protein 385B isoform X2 [Sinocyclocheilus rhinocerous]|uniref:zinc finger protein 385B isoform X2 n=1 Tax=Sinocyclocheilus rhinocerous TaxID=307959 RepID=UPI0007B8533A|nr:PREDICTED: zinc finger protein 385B isoform X2 [Sinocyclocheilus rhinocerous]
MQNSEGMKTPLSPTQLIENGQLFFAIPGCVEVKDPSDSNVDMQLQQEKKKLLYSLCEVCNIQLHSAAQAQVHYNGKSHLKRVKQLNNGELPTASVSSGPAPLHSLSSSGSQGSSCHSNTLPALVRTPSLMMQSGLDMKPFMTFPMESSSPVGLFPNFNTMDPVQKAVINHTFGVSIPPKKKQVISCNICQLRFNSDSQAEAHYKGSKHAKKLKAQESTKNKQKSAAAQDSGAKTITTTTTTSSCTAVTASCSDQPEKSAAPLAAHKVPASPQAFMPLCAPAAPAVALVPSPFKTAPAHASPPTEPTGHAAALQNTSKPAALPTAPSEPSAESEEEKAKKLLYCSLCKVAVNSLSQLEAHNTGSKHKTMLEARNGAGPIKAYPRPGSKLKVQATQLSKGSGLQNKTFHCEICDVHVNSEIQLKQHISSRRHKDRVAGKPTKPKYSPYNKQQRSSGSLAAKLALQNDLVKPISPAFLSTPFCPTTVPSISLHARPNTSIFQTASLPHSFLRAAPGPIRPTTGSILFAPY